MGVTPDRFDGGRIPRVLGVVDWNVDANRVADALDRVIGPGPAAVGLLVPSRLPGLDWIGDPYASRPCAERQLRALVRLAESRGLTVDAALVGDPERVAAIGSALEAWPADRVVLFDRPRLVPNHPLSVPRRIERSRGVPVERVAAPTDRTLGGRARRCGPVAAATA